jgi:adenylate cyclase
MAITNRYLSSIAEAVDATGGYVDKFIGDAVMAMWGAPAADPDHAANAVSAALRSVEKLDAMRAEDEARGQFGYSLKVGINTGLAVVGNIGSAQRYNYTAVGEAVNVAARLESIPAQYGCSIVLGPATAAGSADAFVLNELDWVRVHGKIEAISIFEVVCRTEETHAAHIEYVEAYARALSLYRRGEFIAAVDIWDSLHHPRKLRVGGTPPQVMAGRAKSLAAAPPADWDGIFAQNSK